MYYDDEEDYFEFNYEDEDPYADDYEPFDYDYDYYEGWD